MGYVSCLKLVIGTLSGTYCSLLLKPLRNVQYMMTLFAFNILVIYCCLYFSMCFLFVTAGQCPILIAAQTLCDMATHSFKGLLRWPKKPSQKVMKARKLKPNEKLEETFARSIPVLGSNNLVRSVDQLVPSKKQKLSTIENSKDLDNSNYLRKGPINWSTPRSSRSSPGKSIKDSIVENRHSTASILKQSCMMPPPARVFDKACTSQQKARKLLPMDWNRGRDGLD